MKTEITGCSLEELKGVLAGWKEPAFRAKQIFDWLYKKGAVGFDAMSNLPQGLRARLKETFTLDSLAVETMQTSKDGTRKFLFRLGDGNFVEAVSIPAEKRLTGCISSQAGCKYACGFCASGAAGFKRNLSCAEMVDEVRLLDLDARGQGRELSHIVFMGTGEPLDNYVNVFKAVRLLNSPDAFAIGARRITISTCGIVPGIERMAKEGLQVELSISLHAPDDVTRDKIMPVNRVYPMKRLMPVLAAYSRTTGRQVTFEYILIKDLNSSLQNADTLSRIVKGIDGKVNLIPLNPAVKEFRAASAEETARFRERLERNGANVTVRKARGQDIDAACGQLRLRHEKA